MKQGLKFFFFKSKLQNHFSFDYRKAFLKIPVKKINNEDITDIWKQCYHFPLHMLFKEWFVI